MSQDALSDARARVAPFLLPNLLDAGVGTEVNESFILRKSKNAMALARASLRVTSEVTPQLNDTADTVCKRLRVPRSAVDIFVFPSADLNAFCFLDNHPIVVGLSSHLVDSMPGNELAFVIGHEIGHALFPQTQYFVASSSSLEDQIVARSVELSVDRVGLLASGDKDAAFRAILKTLSGLTDVHLRFDFSHFMSEARAILEDPVSEQQLWSSHPPLAERFRALVSFSLSDAYLLAVGERASAGVPIEQTNRQLAAGPNSIVDRAAHRAIDVLLNDLAIWVSAFVVNNQKKVNLAKLREQCRLEIKRDDLEKAVQLLTSLDPMQQEQACQEKINEAVQKALQLAPRSTAYLIDKLNSEIPELRLQVVHTRRLPA